MLLLTTNKKLFSWGDNYYGQLGIGKVMTPFIKVPEEISFTFSDTPEIKKILAFQDNSFAFGCIFNSSYA